jgi:hypothetical protein
MAEVSAASAPHRRTPFTGSAFTYYALVWQAAVVILYGTCTRFDSEIDTRHVGDPAAQLGVEYSMFQVGWMGGGGRGAAGVCEVAAQQKGCGSRGCVGGDSTRRGGSGRKGTGPAATPRR